MIYTLIRSKRRTVAIYIRNGDIEVRAPLRMSKREIEQFITSKEKWILKNITQSQKQETKRGDFSLNYGDTVLLMGYSCVITAKDISVAGKPFWFDEEALYIKPGLTPDEIKHTCVELYKNVATNILACKTHEFARQMSVEPSDVKVNSAKARWGSCSAKKSINYSWRLIMADEEVVDYVVVHELAHLIELNHSKRFWAIVESVLPDYKDRKKRLRELQQRLSGEDWD